MSTKITTPEPTHEEEYICVTCGTRQTLKNTQAVLCSHCHSRIFRKIRTTHLVKYLAR